MIYLLWKRGSGAMAHLGDTLTARTMWGRRVTLRGQMQVSWMKERHGVMGPATRTL